MKVNINFARAICYVKCLNERVTMIFVEVDMIGKMKMEIHLEVARARNYSVLSDWMSMNLST